MFQLNKANTSDTKTAFLGLHFSISNGIVSTKLYDKCEDFDFEIVNFSFLDGDVPCSTSSISLNSFVLHEHLAIWLTSTLTINCYFRNFLDKAICIINFAKPFLNLIDKSMI